VESKEISFNSMPLLFFKKVAKNFGRKAKEAPLMQSLSTEFIVFVSYFLMTSVSKNQEKTQSILRRDSATLLEITSSIDYRCLYLLFFLQKSSKKKLFLCLRRLFARGAEKDRGRSLREPWAFAHATLFLHCSLLLFLVFLVLESPTHYHGTL
jgi:hypothetical protein